MAPKLTRPDSTRYVVCPHCQQTFTTKKRDQSYCSPECSAEALRAKLREADPLHDRDATVGVRLGYAAAPVPCEWCGVPFMRKRREQRYCGLPCVRQAGSKRLEELRAAGEDPAHGGKAAEARAEAIHKRLKQNAAVSKLTQEQRAYLETAIQDGRPVVLEAGDTRPACVHFTLQGDASRIAGERWSQELREGSIITLAGHGCRLTVDKDALILQDGGTHSTAERETRKLYRGVHGVSTILVLSDAGSLSLAALQWTRDQDISVFVLDRNGKLVSSVCPPSLLSATLRRAQYTTDPVPLARDLVTWKLRESSTARPAISEACAAAERSCEKARSVEALRLIEADAALWYWQAWSMDLRFAGHVPPHWRRFEGRTSAINSRGSPRDASHPANAILNYGYTVLGAEIERAIVSRGLDPAAGHLHVGREGRASLVWDLIEPLRPRLDAALLTWVAGERWTRADFSVDCAGVVRLHPALARVVVQKAALPEGALMAVLAWYVATLRGIASVRPSFEYTGKGESILAQLF